MNAPSFLLFFIIGGEGRQLPFATCLAVKGDGRPQEARFRVSEMGVLQTPKRFLPSKLHFVQLTRGERIFLSSVVTRPCEKWGVVLF